jgi:hypothetical protein
MSDEDIETQKVYKLQLPPRQEAISLLLRKGESCTQNYLLGRWKMLSDVGMSKIQNLVIILVEIA